MARKLDELTINKHRLEGNPIEQKTLEWLNQSTISSNMTNLESLKNDILCMNACSENYSHLESIKQAEADKLHQNENTVDIALATIFQWFGSHVGYCNLKKLIDD